MSEQYQGSYQGNYGSKQRGQKHQYAVDMVFCIDATGSMEDFSGKQQKIINMVKNNALHFYEDMSNIMAAKDKQMAQLRVKVIVFRDYIADGADAMLQTDFFLLPQQSAEFEDIINSIHAEGGGDVPEDGLEALAYAMKAKWTTYEGAKKRQVIVVWTDAGTHELGYGKSSEYYPSGMPANLAELEDWWDAMDDYAKRLIIYAPNTNYWNYISDNWEKVYHVDSVAGDGMSEHDYGEILEMISSTI